MRLSIRLQNHGKKNHPYWRIVVAPQHKNIFGRCTEHIGFWSPRHNVNIKRQIILNLPRLWYWLGNGAVPTYKVHKFLHMYGIFPKPWQYVSTTVFILRVCGLASGESQEAKTLLINDTQIKKLSRSSQKKIIKDLASQIQLSSL